MKNKNCISRFFAFIKRMFHLWRTVQKNSTFVECDQHDDCTQVTVHVTTGPQVTSDEEDPE